MVSDEERKEEEGGKRGKEEWRKERKEKRSEQGGVVKGEGRRGGEGGGTMCIQNQNNCNRYKQIFHMKASQIVLLASASLAVIPMFTF